MACGLPVIASRVGGIPNLVKDGVTGWLVPPGDVKAISEKLAWLALRLEVGRRFGMAGRERTATLATWEEQGNGPPTSCVF